MELRRKLVICYNHADPKDCFFTQSQDLPQLLDRDGVKINVQ